MGMIGIIGATGKVGRELVRELKKRNARFCALARDQYRAAKVLGEEVKVVPFSYEEPATYGPALEGIEQLFLLFPDGVPNLQKKVENFLSQAQAKGVKHVVAMTGMSADQYPKAWMAQMEQKVKECKIPYTLLRPNWFMQNFDAFFGHQIRRQHSITLPAGEATTSFVDIRDIAEVAATVLTEKGHENRIYTLTGPEALSHEEIAQHLSDHVGFEVAYEPQTEEQILHRWQIEGWPLPMIEEMVLLYSKVREGIFSDCSQDVEKVLKRPPHSFADYVSECKTCWQKEQKV